MDASVRFDTQIIGALPVIVHYFERLQLGEIIDEVVPWEGEVPLGTVVEIMIANRLLNPQALYRIGEWAHKAGLTDYYGVTAEQLNDDLLGRALERLAKHADVIEAALVTKMIKVFKVQVKQIHFDITDVELYGAYEQQFAEGQTPPTPLPAYGRTKSGRKNVKQIGMGLNVTADGGVPIGHLPLDGNAAESPVHLDNLRALAKTLGKTDFPLHRGYEARHDGQPAGRRRRRWVLPVRRRLPDPSARGVSRAETPRQVAQGGLLPPEPGRTGGGRARQVRGRRDDGGLGGHGGGANAPRQVPADLRVERGEGPAGGPDPRAARVEDPRGIRGDRAEPEQVQLDHAREDSGSAGIGQGEVLGRQPVRIPVDEGPEGYFPSDVEDQRPRNFSG